MKSKRLRYFSMLMAVMLLTTSVGITAKVHYCLMDIQQTTSDQIQDKCCDKETTESCCETMNESSCSASAINENSCCKDEIKSFSFPTTFVNKIISVELNQLVTLLHFITLQHVTDAGEQHYSEVLNIFSPPKISGTALLYFKGVLNL